MDRDTILKHTPIVGPEQGTPEWLDDHRRLLTASICAAAIGESEYKQPLDIYHLLRGNVEPFEGNERTERGTRFEPFIAGEYEVETGHDVFRSLPIQYHGHFQFIGASPDARTMNRKHGVEFKACNYRQAAKLGAEGTDNIFNEWLVQAQVQCLCYEFDVVDVFVMVDLHTYKLYRVERNDDLICAIVERLVEFWENTQAGIEPPFDPTHGNAKSLMDSLYGDTAQGEVHLGEADALRWAEYRRLGNVITDMEAERESLRNLVLQSMGTAKIGRLPLGKREVVRTVVKDSIWTPDDVRIAQEKQGEIKRRGGVRLTERDAST